ncbi:MAG: lanthionine synthetase LanC family protein [Thermomicrobiales bacterium]
MNSLEPDRMSSRELQVAAIATAQNVVSHARWQDPNRLWPETPLSTLHHPSSFYTGSLGVSQFLLNVANATGNHNLVSASLEAVNWSISNYPINSPRSLSGLFFGQAWLPLLLYQLSQSMADPRLTEMSLDVAEQLPQVPQTVLDISNGLAGVGFMHTYLYSRTNDDTQLRYAESIAKILAKTVIRSPDGSATWLSRGKQYWGFAHGIAGIGYFYQTLFNMTNNEEYAALSDGAWKTLLSNTVSTAAGKGMSWRRHPDDSSPPWSHWCNGASGVGWFALARTKQGEGVALKRVAYSVEQSSAIGTLCVCHGIAGDGMFLVTLGRVRGVQKSLSISSRIEKLMVIKNKRGTVWEWPLELSGTPSPDFMTGYGGIFTFLLMADQPDLHMPLFDTPLVPRRD